VTVPVVVCVVVVVGVVVSEEVTVVVRVLMWQSENGLSVPS